jgi:hypothetical protein
MPLANANPQFEFRGTYRNVSTGLKEPHLHRFCC